MMDQTKQSLYNLCLRLGDTSLISGHRLSEWCGHGPILEEDIALTNIALDLIGQSRMLLTYAGELEGKGRSEDDMAYHRDILEFRNFMLAEQPNGDYGQTMVRQFMISALLYHLYDVLKGSSDKTISGIAEKSLKEVTYHLRHSSEWVIRFGDGTEESAEKVKNAVELFWMYTGDMFEFDGHDEVLSKAGIIPDLSSVKEKWDNTVKDVFNRARLEIPSNTFMLTGSVSGRHTEHLGYILAELQFLPRAYPDAKW